jgi:ceramide glucosyltransferase
LPTYPSLVLFAAAAVGLVFLAVQCVVLRRHVRGPAPRRTPPISILKPLCGLGRPTATRLVQSLEYRVRCCWGYGTSMTPPSVSRGCGARALDRSARGRAELVNQLVAARRRRDVLVVSDSNVRVEPGSGRALQGRRGPGAPIAGGRGASARLDHLHLAGSVAPGVVAAKRLVGRDIVVGKSMALRRRDLDALGGFEAVKDVLAEDYVLGLLVRRVLGKRVSVGHRPIQNVSERRTVREFAARYARWSVLQRQAVGPFVYSAQALLNPVLLASAAAALERTPSSLGLLATTCAAKAALDGASARALRPSGFRVGQLALVPVKDLVIGAAWMWGLLRRDVAWRGTRLVVRRGTRIDPALAREVECETMLRA